MKILVVDDSAVMRKVLIGALEKGGIIDTGEAEDGAKTVEAVKTGDYDLVLLDWNMPGMSGIEALRAIRGAGNEIPIIMVTTEAQRWRVIEALKSGANNYIVKPFQQNHIISKIKETMAKATA